MRLPSTCLRTQWPLLLLGVSGAGLIILALWARGSHYDPDTLFHLTTARLYLTHGWLSSFPWMHSTEWTEHFTNPYLLTQLALVPSVAVFDDPIVAVDVLIVFAGVLALISAALVLNRLDVPRAALMALPLLGVSSMTIVRLGMYKGTAFFTIIWLWSIWALIERRHRLVFALSWLAVYFYTGFPLLLATAMAQVAAFALRERRLDWAPLGATAGGIAAALIINPFWPHHLSFYAAEIGDSFLRVGLRPGVNFGAEWMTLSTWDYLRFGFLPLGLTAVLAIVQYERGGRLSTTALFLWLLTFGLVLLSFRSIKFMDYLALAAWLSTVVTFTELGPWPRVVRFGASLAVAALCAVNAWNGLGDLRQARDSLDYDTYERLSEFLVAHTADGECVVVPWDDYPHLLFLSEKNSYPVGMNPSYLNRPNDKRFTAYSLLYEGKVTDPDQLIRQFFDARYLVVRVAPRNRGESELRTKLAAYAKMRLVYGDGQFEVYEAADIGSGP